MIVLEPSPLRFASSRAPGAGGRPDRRAASPSDWHAPAAGARSVIRLGGGLASLLCLLLAACPAEEPLPCGEACEPSAGGSGGSAGAGGTGGTGGLGAVEFLAAPTVRVPSATVAVVEFSATRLAEATLSAGPAGEQPTRTQAAAATTFQVVLGGLSPGTAHELTVELRAPGGATSATESLSFTTPEAGAPLRILFDAAHGEDAGNADWLLDEPGAAVPSPPDPGGPEDWAGAYSSFGYELYRTGRFELRSNPRGVELTAGSLAGVAVLVIPEANRLLPAAEAEAIWEFVRGGGGLLLLGNHAGSDRDGDGQDGADVADALLAAAPELGIRLVKNDIEREDPTTALGEHLLLRGPSAPVRALSFFDATELTVEAPAVELARRARTEPGTGVLAAAVSLGTGRVVVVGDSAGADDGTGHPGNTLFNGWNDYDNGEFYVNCVSWLAGEL